MESQALVATHFANLGRDMATDLTQSNFPIVRM